MPWFQLAAAVALIAMAALEPSPTTPMAIGVGCSFIVNAVGNMLGKSQSLPLNLASITCAVLGFLVALH